MTLSTRLLLSGISLAVTFPAAAASRKTAELEVVNKTGVEVYVYYVDEGGEERFHGTLLPEDRSLQETRIGMTWVYRKGAQKKQIRRLTVGAFQETVMFEADPAPASNPRPVNVLAGIDGHPKLGGITLPSGFMFVPKRGGACSVYGGIAGPGKLDITYSVWVIAQPGQPRHSGHFISQAKTIGDKRWYKERYVNGELAELAISQQGLLVVSYPRRGINLEAVVNGEGQLTDALLIMLSIPNTTRGLSWEDALTVLEKGDVQDVGQFHSLGVVIRMANGVEYRTREPKIDAVIDVLKRLGKLDSIAVATE
jgi:hypothetical protein